MTRPTGGRSLALACVLGAFAALAVLTALLATEPWARPRGSDPYPWVLWAVATGQTVDDDDGAPVAEFEDLAESPGGPRPRRDYRVARDDDGRPTYRQEWERSLAERIGVLQVTHCGLPRIYRAVGVARSGPDGRTWAAFLTAPYFGDLLRGDEEHDARCAGVWEISQPDEPVWRVELMRYGGDRGGTLTEPVVAPRWGVRGDVLVFVPRSDHNACIGLLSDDGCSFTGLCDRVPIRGRRVN